MKAQQIPEKQLDTFIDDVDSEFINIKNQIVKRFYVEYDPVKLKIILNTLGCKTLEDCQTLLDISSIQYVIKHTSWVKHYIGRGEQANKKLNHSATVTITNNSNEKRDLITTFEDWNVTQEFQVDINKTDHLFTETKIMPISFTADKPFDFTFNKNNVESANQSQPFVLNTIPQNVSLEPLTKKNVTYNIVQYDEFNYYSMDFIIFETSTITHPVVDKNVVFITTNLLKFLKTRIEFVKTMTFKNSRVVRLDVTTETSRSNTVNVFKLNNFPAIEKITNFAVETEYSDSEPIETPPKPTTEAPITPPLEITAPSTDSTVAPPEITTQPAGI